MRVFKKSNIEFKNDKEPQVANKVYDSVKDFVEKQEFTQDRLVRNLPFILFLAVLGIVYIANQYHAEKLVNEVNQLKKERKEKRAEYISAASDLMRITRQSEVIKLVEKKNLGLKPLTSPPKKIIVEKE